MSDQPSGTQRAAAFLLSLEKEAAAEVIKHLDKNVIVEIVEAMGSLDPSMTESEAVKQMNKEFVKALRRPKGLRVRSEEEMHQMLQQTIGREQADELFEKIHERLLHERPFLSIEKDPAENIHKVLAEESDTVAALVLAHLDPSLSAEVLSAFEPDRSFEIVRRMTALIPPAFETLVAIAQDLKARLEALAAGPVTADPSARLKSIAEVLNYSEPEIEKTVLDGLTTLDAAMAEEIREYMFTWEDLAEIDKRSMQKILASIDTKTLSISLKACSQQVEDNIMGNLSQRVRDMVADERELAGPMPMAEVMFARNEVMKAVRGLMESGEFSPVKGGEELVT